MRTSVKSKILMLSWEFPPCVDGGLGRHVAELAPALAEQGVTVHVLTPYPEPIQSSEEIFPGLIVHRANIAAIDQHADIYTQATRGNKYLVEVAEALWSELGGFDLIHAHDWLVGFAAITLKQKYKCPIVVTFHATERGRWRSDHLANGLSQAINRAENVLSFEAWRIIACSHYMITELRRYFHLPADKLDMIPNGVNLAKSPQFSREELAAFKAQYVSVGNPLIFSVGRLVYEKGHHILIGSMPQILEAFPGTKLVIAGRGPLLGYLQSIVSDLGINNSVHFAGFVSDLERDKFFAVADCAVFPSLYEPFGIVALEAMTFNCPVVVSNLGGLAEVVDHEKTGLLIYPDNSESAAWGVLQTLERPSLASKCALNARQMLEEKYNWARIAKETKKVYERVITERATTDW